MRIVLENELEKQVWAIMMEAHFKWNKNHGDSLREQMEWYFEELYRKETDRLVDEEVDRRLREEYRDMQADIADERGHVSEEVRRDLRFFYYTFFNAPEKLTVIYNGKVIQGGE